MFKNIKINIEVTAGELLKITCSDITYFNDIFKILRVSCKIPVMWERGENSLYLTKSYKKSDGLHSTGTYKAMGGEVAISCASHDTTKDLVDVMLLKDAVFSRGNVIYFYTTSISGDVGSSLTTQISGFGFTKTSISDLLVALYSSENVVMDQRDIDILQRMQVKGECVSKLKSTFDCTILERGGICYQSNIYEGVVGDDGQPVVRTHKVRAVDFIRQCYKKCIAESAENLPFLAEAIKFLLKCEISLSPSVLASNEEYLASLEDADHATTADTAHARTFLIAEDADATGATSSLFDH